MSRKPVWIAVAVTLAAVAAVVASAVAPRGVDSTMTVTAKFEDTVGLYVGNAVSVLGMPVGTVSSIVPKDSYVEVTLVIDRSVDVPADVQAVTVSTSVLTDREVELTPPYRGGPKLRTGDVVGLSRTRTPVEFDRTLALIDKLSVALRGDGNGHGPLGDLVGLGAQISTQSGPDIKATLDKLSQALRLSADNGAGSRQDIQAIVSNVAEMTQAAAENDGDIREFGSNIRQLSDVVADQALGSGRTGAKIDQILEEAAALLNDNRERLKGAATDAASLTSAINDNRRELAEFFDVTPMLMENVYNAIDANSGGFRGHAVADKSIFNMQYAKELCNLIGLKQLGCATGTLQDYGPDFGLTGMLEMIAGAK